MSWAAHARNLWGPWLRGAYRVRVIGAHRCPTRGGVILAAHSRGSADAAIMALLSPRPVHVIVDAPAGVPSRIPEAVGRIVVSRPSSAPRALRHALEMLQQGRAVGVFVARDDDDPSESRFPRSSASAATAAWLQARSGSPIVPVCITGTAVSRGRTVPRLGSTVTLSFSDPIESTPLADPWSRRDIRQRAEALRQAVEDFTQRSEERIASDSVGPGAVGPGMPAPDNGLS